MLEKICLIFIFAFSLPHMAIMGKTHSNFSLHKRGWFLIQRIANFILCDNYLVASRLCMGKAHLKIRYDKWGLGSKKDCVMNMRDLRHEYEAPAS